MKISQRDRYLIGLAVGVVCLGLLAQFAIMPFISRLHSLEGAIAAKREGLREMARLGREHQAFQSDSEGIAEKLARRRKDFTLFSFLEAGASEARVKDKIKSMKPSESSGKGPFQESQVEMKLERITLEELVSYLKRIEAPEQAVTIKRLAVNNNKQEAEYLDAIIQVLTFQ